MAGTVVFFISTINMLFPIKLTHIHQLKNMIKSRLFSTVITFLICISLHAQPPVGTGDYYRSADGLCGRELKTALWNIIKNPEVDSYDGLWADYSLTDMNPEGYVWDMYSTQKYTSFDKKQNSSEGSGLNREHSMPKSWFKLSDADLTKSPMYSDIVHVIPVDGWINTKRSNLPYGETASNTGSANRFSRWGKSTVSGYTGTVFEPNDLYKGDLARIYFYMATCYEDLIAGWSSDMLAGDSYSPFSNWASSMLLAWAQRDPVSLKEIDRNNKVYTIQYNRNPFVDYPGLEQYIWGELSTTPFSYDNYTVPQGHDGDSAPDVYYGNILKAPFINSLDGFTIEDVNKGGLRSIWSATEEYGMKATAFSGSARAAESWLVSPVVDLTEAHDVVLKFQHTGKFFGSLSDEATLWARAEGGEWQQLPIDKYFSNQNWTFVKCSASLSAFEGHRMQVGFRYASTNSNAGTWEIKSLAINGYMTDSSTGILVKTVRQENADNHIYNLAGQRVDHPTRGIYIRNGKKFIIR